MLQTPVDGTNPYEAPRATLLAEAPLEGFAEAIRPFSVTRGVVRGLSVLAVLVGIASGLGALFAVAIGTPSAVALARTLALFAGAYVLHGVMHWRLASRIAEAARKAELGSVNALLAALRQSWLASLALYAVSFGSALMSGGGAATTMSTIVFADAVADGARGEARKLRTVLHLVIAASVALTVLTIVQSGAGEVTRVVGSAVVLAPLGGAYTWLLWRQAAPLPAFIANPSPETLAPLARAHRWLWIVLTFSAMLVIGMGVLAAFLVVLFNPALPEQG